ncbi:MAG TPA: tRNA adenosine(34) deaminase TadA [Candidatus Polarisedimenticolaceae bacterium]|nr:tRNA adenosine(34) deaminase TadA [Candidatus Polarisedimenticolaceae bacterium]
MDRDERYMRLALNEAAKARRAGEVPVGALVVLGDEVLGRGHNASVERCDATAHAEILALRDAGGRLGNYRLSGAVLYSTVEPCLMCLGAAVHARIARVVYGAPDAKAGGIARLEAMRAAGADFNHRFATAGGVLADQAAELLLDFFRERRAAGRTSEEETLDEGSGEVPKWS